MYSDTSTGGFPEPTVAPSSAGVKLASDADSKKSCAVCSRDNCAYKCPRCFSRYCSANCCKVHRLECRLVASDDEQSRKVISILMHHCILHERLVN